MTTLSRYKGNSLFDTMFNDIFNDEFMARPYMSMAKRSMVNKRLKCLLTFKKEKVSVF